MISGFRSMWRDFPVKQVTVLGVLLTAESFTGSVVAPFLPFLTHDFFPHLESNQLGYYAGFLMSAFFAGTFIGCFLWGKLSDIVGRRPILLCGCTGLMLSTFMLGFSFSFAWAVSVLFFGGFLNGNLGVAKTYLYEFCSPRFHAVAFSIIWIPSSIARFVGPVLGGFFACPATRFHNFDKPFFKEFPYLLPCGMVAFLEMCILIGSCIFLGESLHKKTGDEYVTLSQMSTQDVEEDDTENPDLSQFPTHAGREDSTCRLLRDKLVLIPCALYALFALVEICCNQQLLPLLLVSDSHHGGYNFNAAELSIVMTTAAIYSVVTQATLIPFLASKFTYKTLYLSGVALYGVGVILLPSMVDITGSVKSPHLLTDLNQAATSVNFTLNYTTAPEHVSTLLQMPENYTHPTLVQHSGRYLTRAMNTTAVMPLTGQCRLPGDRGKNSKLPASEIPARVWGPLLLVVMLMEQGLTQAYMGAIVMVGNAAFQSTRGTVNGIAQTLAALSRLIGPAVSANLFAWTTDNGLPWPMDHHLSFYLLIVLSLLTGFLCTRLPASSNLPRLSTEINVQRSLLGDSEGKEQVEEEEKKETQSIQFSKSNGTTWTDGIDNHDDLETACLITSDIT